MKFRPTILVAFVLGLFLAIPVFAQDPPVMADERPGVAVMPLSNGGSYGPDPQDLEAMQVGLQQMIITELAQNSGLRIVERAAIRDILAEQDLADAGRVDAATAAQVGRIVGARYMVLGTFMDLNGDFRLDTRIVDVETTENPWSGTVRGERDDLYALLVEMAEKITAGADLPSLDVEIREAREAREIPAEAVTLYSRAQVLEDVGRPEQARELYQRIVSDFPEMTEAGTALEQLDGTGSD